MSVLVFEVVDNAKEETPIIINKTKQNAVQPNQKRKKKNRIKNKREHNNNNRKGERELS